MFGNRLELDLPISDRGIPFRLSFEEGVWRHGAQDGGGRGFASEFFLQVPAVSPKHINDTKKIEHFAL